MELEFGPRCRVPVTTQASKTFFLIWELYLAFDLTYFKKSFWGFFFYLNLEMFSMSSSLGNWDYVHYKINAFSHYWQIKWPVDWKSKSLMYIVLYIGWPIFSSSIKRHCSTFNQIVELHFVSGHFTVAFFYSKI